MKLEIRLFAGLKCNNQDLSCYGKTEFELDVPEEITTLELQQILQLNSKYPLINLVNGLSKPNDWKLAAGDRVGIFPPIGGG